MKAFLVQAALVAFAAGTPLTADAQTTQNWPSRQSASSCPFAAGGSTDIAARLVGGHLSHATGTAVLRR